MSRWTLPDRLTMVSVGNTEDAVRREIKQLEGERDSARSWCMLWFLIALPTIFEMLHKGVTLIHVVRIKLGWD